MVHPYTVHRHSGADPGIEKRGFVPLTCMVPPTRARAVRAYVRGLCTRPSITFLLRIVISLDSVTAIGFKGQRNNNCGGGRRPGFEAIRDSYSASRASCASQVAPPPTPGPSVSLEIKGPSAIATSGPPRRSTSAALALGLSVG